MKYLKTEKKIKRIGSLLKLLILLNMLVACDKYQVTGKTTNNIKRLKIETVKTYSLKKKNRGYTKVFEQNGTVKYDKAGNVTEIKTQYLMKDFITWVKMRYDDNNDLIETITYGADGSVKSRFSVSQKGNKKERLFYDGNGTLQSKEVEQYNEMGKLTESVEYDAEEKIIEKNIFKYNNDGCLKEIFRYNSNNELINKTLATCDNNGRFKETMAYDSKGNIIYKTNTTYDKEGHIVELISHYGERRVHLMNERQFDDNGNVIHETNYKIIDEQKIPFKESIHEYTYYP